MRAPELAGPQDALLVTPDRRPKSVRRTTSIDSFRRPDGSVVEVEATARDLRTDADGLACPLAMLHLQAELDQAAGTIAWLDANPPQDRSDALLGCRVGAGFRQSVKDQLGPALEAGSLMSHVLDDWPGASLVSGYARQRASEVAGAEPVRIPVEYLSSMTDICAGWATEASIVVVLGRTAVVPTPVGPSVPMIETGADELGWHAMASLRSGATRRRRRLDLWVSDEVTLGFETHFRDSYAEDDDTQSVLHEYLVSGTLGRDDLAIQSLAARALVLPWMECPSALASAQRLIGVPVAGLRALVRTEFQGTSTCTHLNDTLRTLEDLAAMALGIG